MIPGKKRGSVEMWIFTVLMVVATVATLFAFGPEAIRTIKRFFQ